MKALVLHGFMGNSLEKKARLEQNGFLVCLPKLSSLFFHIALKQAQKAFDLFQPDIIIGSSRGGAVALKINSGEVPLILMAPAWRRWGKINKTNKPCTIIHGNQDTVIPIEDSVELANNSPRSKLVIVNDKHRLIKTGGDVMLKAARRYS